ncbi:MAG: hypothetical protein E7214_08135 [Clostridium sp.]|nr:hypothetical protein [Clostridium sp.]
MKMKMLLASIGAASIMIISSIGMTYAGFFTSSDSKENNFSSGNVEINISEKFEKPIGGWDGSKHEKEVKIENKSNVPALIRVAVYPRWITNQGDWWSGNSDFVKLEYGDDVSIPSDSNTGEKWIKDNNDDRKVKYYYYNTILEPNALTKELIKSVTLSLPDKTFQEKLIKYYERMYLAVDVKAETIIATKEAYKAAWSDIDNPEIVDMLDKLCDK